MVGVMCETNMFFGVVILCWVLCVSVLCVWESL